MSKYLFIAKTALDRRYQHWVARTYLKGWRDPATPNGAYVWISPKDPVGASRRVSPKRAFVGENLNTLVKGEERNLSLEHLLQRFEAGFGAIKTRLESGTPPRPGDMEAVVAFVAAQLIRTPKFRSFWQLRQETSPVESSEADPVIRQQVDNIGAVLIRNRHQVLMFVTLPKAVEVLGNMRATFLRTEDSLGFISSDAPCCTIDYADKPRSFLKRLESKTSSVVMPLSSRLAVVFNHAAEPDQMIALLPNHPIRQEINAIVCRAAVNDIVSVHPLRRREWLSESVASRLQSFDIW